MVARHWQGLGTTYGSQDAEAHTSAIRSQYPAIQKIRPPQYGRNISAIENTLPPQYGHSTSAIGQALGLAWEPKQNLTPSKPGQPLGLLQPWRGGGLGLGPNLARPPKTYFSTGPDLLSGLGQSPRPGLGTKGKSVTGPSGGRRAWPGRAGRGRAGRGREYFQSTS